MAFRCITSAAAYGLPVNPDVPTIQGSVLARMRASISDAGNAYTNQPLITPAAWVASTAVYAGQSVVNGGNNYLCLTAGTTAASGGPTGTSNAAITDNGAVWYYAGPSFSSTTGAPGFASVGFSSRYTTGSTFWRTTACTYAVGASQISDLSNFRLMGSVFTDGTGGVSGQSNGTTAQFSFSTDSTAFQIVCSGGTAPQFQVSVIDPALGDGVIPLTLGYGSGGTNGGSINFLQVTFSNKKARTFIAEASSSPLDFLGVLCADSTSRVWYPSFPNSVKMAFVGSSYISGSAQHPVCHQLGVGPLIAKSLGMVDYYTDSAGGGTGYLASSSSTNYQSTSRFNAMVGYSPEVLVVTGGGINDRNVSGVTQASEQAAIQSYLSQVRNALPNVLIFVVGSESGSTGPATNIFTMEAAVAAAVAAQGDPLCWYISQSSTVSDRAWIAGTGNTASTTGSGDADVYIGADGIHPVQAGVNYLAARHNQGIVNTINALVL